MVLEAGAYKDLTMVEASSYLKHVDNTYDIPALRHTLTVSGLGLGGGAAGLWGFRACGGARLLCLQGWARLQQRALQLNTSS